MRHGVKRVKFNRNQGERKALMRSLLLALFTHERIVTTQAKAKAVKPMADQMITRAKRSDLATKRLLLSRLPHEDAVRKLMEDIAPRYDGRISGYSRIIQLGPRMSDSAPMARLELLDSPTSETKPSKSSEKGKEAPATIRPAEASGRGKRTAKGGKVAGPEREGKTLKEKAVSRRQSSTKKEAKK